MQVQIEKDRVFAPKEIPWLKPGTNQSASPLSVLPCLLNIQPFQVSRLEHGFGQHWEKIYEIRLNEIDISPEEVSKVWRERFAHFWPAGNLFYPPAIGIQPGEIALLKLAIPGQKWPFMATGVLVDEVTPTSFTYTALGGHPIAGSMTFRTYRADDGTTVAQAHARLRASDPLYELAIRISGKKEDAFWMATLEKLALQLGSKGEFRQTVKKVDSNLHWWNAKNIFQNAAIRSAIYYLLFPFRFLIFLVNGVRRSLP